MSKIEKSELELLKEKREELKNESVKVGGSEGGRKNEILGYLKEGYYSIKELGVKVGIKEKNVSSILCYLRKDGNVLKRNSVGKLKYMGNMVEMEKEIKRLEELEEKK